MTINRHPVTHQLKCDRESTQPLRRDEMTAQIRHNDRNFKPGDLIVFNETRYSGFAMRMGDVLEYTGNVTFARITHVQPLADYKLGNCVALSIKVYTKGFFPVHPPVATKSRYDIGSMPQGKIKKIPHDHHCAFPTRADCIECPCLSECLDAVFLSGGFFPPRPIILG